MEYTNIKIQETCMKYWMQNVTYKKTEMYVDLLH